MKKLILFTVLMLFIGISINAQTYYPPMNHGKHILYTAYVSAMTDSVGNYYHQKDGENNYIDLSGFTNISRFIPIWFTHSSTVGAVSITTTLEGRTYDKVAGDWGSWYTIDTLATASSTETEQEITTALADGERPMQIRIKFDGQAGNRSDTVIKSKILLLKD